MKKTLIALMALAGTVVASDSTTYSPLSGTPYYTQSVTLNAEAGTVTPSAADWKTYGVATYRYEPFTLSETNEILTFSFTVSRPYAPDPSDNNKEKSLNLLSMAFVGTSKAYVIGHGNTSDYTSAASELQIGTSTNVDANGARGYLFMPVNSGIVAGGLSGVESLAGGLPFGTTTVNGTVAWNTEQDAFVMTVTSSAVQGALTYTIGNELEVKDIIFTVQGLNAPTISDATITYSIVPEPATATLSLLALAGLAARRRRK